MNKPKQKGTFAESAVVAYLRTRGFPYAERLALQGGKDRGDITGIPGIVIEVKNTQTYTFSSWLKEAAVEKDNASADFAFVAAKPRLVGSTRVGLWMAAMPVSEFNRLCVQAANESLKAGLPIPAGWMHRLNSNAINRDIGKALLNLPSFVQASDSTFGWVLVKPPGVDDVNSWYAVTILEYMSALLVRAGYGSLNNDNVV